MSVWKRAMDYLGLGPDDAYDDYDQAPMEPEPPMRASRGGYDPEPRVARAPSRGGLGYDDHDLGVRPVQRAAPHRDPDPIPARPRVTFPDDSGITPRPARQGSAVRAVSPPQGEPYTVRPRRFDQALKSPTSSRKAYR